MNSRKLTTRVASVLLTLSTVVAAQAEEPAPVGHTGAVVHAHPLVSTRHAPGCRAGLLRVPCVGHAAPDVFGGTQGVAGRATQRRVTQTVTVLTEPQGEAAVVATVVPGQILDVLDERDGWHLVRPPDATATWRTGWIRGEATSPVTTSPVRSPVQPSPPTVDSAERKGFIIGLGFGAGIQRHTQEEFRGAGAGFEDVTRSQTALVTDFRIGYAPSDVLLLHYSNKVAWGLGSDSSYDAVGFSGFGTTVMFRRTSPSPFITGAIGIGIATNLDRASVETGLGFSIGGGYEFARRWSVDAEALFFRLEDAGRHTVFKAGISWLFY